MLGDSRLATVAPPEFRAESKMRRIQPILCALVVLLAGAAGAADVEMFEQSPMNYSATAPHESVTRLQAQWGDTGPAGNSDRDLVAGLLRELQIPVESQVVVFSRTSFQRRRISPERPRTLYFSDDAYIGWVPAGLVEVVAIDPQLGPVFYTLDPLEARTNYARSFVRDSDCLRCHGGTFVRDIPGVFVRSLYADATGEPLFQGGSQVVDFRTPFAERWGGSCM